MPDAHRPAQDRAHANKKRRIRAITHQDSIASQQAELLVQELQCNYVTRVVKQSFDNYCRRPPE